MLHGGDTGRRKEELRFGKKGTTFFFRMGHNLVRRAITKGKGFEGVQVGKKGLFGKILFFKITSQENGAGKKYQKKKPTSTLIKYKFYCNCTGSC